MEVEYDDRAVGCVFSSPSWRGLPCLLGVTSAFRVGGDAPHRVLRSAIEAAEALGKEVVAQVVSLDGTSVAVPRLAPTVPDRTATGEVRAMSLYAGESAGSVKSVLPAGAVVRELAEEAERLLRQPR